MVDSDQSDIHNHLIRLVMSAATLVRHTRGEQSPEWRALADTIIELDKRFQATIEKYARMSPGGSA